MKLTKQIIISISSILLCSCTYTHLGKTTINYEDSSHYIDGNRTINNNITTLNINWSLEISMFFLMKIKQVLLKLRKK